MITSYIHCRILLANILLGIFENKIEPVVSFLMLSLSGFEIKVILTSNNKCAGQFTFNFSSQSHG